jgi:hypothetical protein
MMSLATSLTRVPPRCAYGQTSCRACVTDTENGIVQPESRKALNRKRAAPTKAEAVRLKFSRRCVFVEKPKRQALATLSHANLRETVRRTSTAISLQPCIRLDQGEPAQTHDFSGAGTRPTPVSLTSGLRIQCVTPGTLVSKCSHEASESPIHIDPPRKA